MVKQASRNHQSPTMSAIFWAIYLPCVCALGTSKPLINVVWFKCTDLRTHDHAALKAAHSDKLPVLHLYVFDPLWYEGKTRLCGFPKTGVLRTRFQLEALEDLQNRLESRGHRLNVRTNVSTAECFRELSKDYSINAVFAFHEVCSEELQIQREVQHVLRQTGPSPLRLYWGYELLHPDDLPFDTKDRAAFKEIEVFLGRVKGVSPRPSAQQEPDFVTGPERAIHWWRARKAIPRADEVMGSNYLVAEDLAKESAWQGGETAALARIQEYLWDHDRLALDYVGATSVRSLYRSPLDDEATSKLSPWLAHGCLSPRLLYEEVTRYVSAYRQKLLSTGRAKQEYTHSGIGIRNPYNVSHRIVRELLWRDFTRFGSIEAGTNIFKIGGRDKTIRQTVEGPRNPQHLPSWHWSSDRGLLQAWIDGRTGFPFIDSSMRELKATGYCKHIGRLCTGWFLISDLGLDWRMGGEWYESILLDYEPALNWFNWVYGCLEPINPHKAQVRGQQQCREILEAGIVHDPDAAYIKRWIPELSELPPLLAREPWRLNPEDIRWASKSTSLRKMPFLRGFQAPPLVQQGGRQQGYEEHAGDTSFPGLQLWRRLVSFLLPKLTGLFPARLAPRAGATPRSFRYGVDYPKPVIQPISLMDAERAEAQVHAARAISKQQRDEEVAWLKTRQQ
eukprot:s235_g3.t1